MNNEVQKLICRRFITRQTPYTQYIVLKNYPNPSDGQLTVKGDNINFLAVKIVNSMGQVVLEQAWDDGAADISGLARGMYFVLVETGEGVVVRKVVRD